MRFILNLFTKDYTEESVDDRLASIKQHHEETRASEISKNMMAAMFHYRSESDTLLESYRKHLSQHQYPDTEDGEYKAARDLKHIHRIEKLQASSVSLALQAASGEIERLECDNRFLMKKIEKLTKQLEDKQ